MDIPKIKIKEILAQLSVLRNYSRLFLPLVIALVAVILLIVSQMFGRGLRDQMESESVRMANQISRMSEDTVPREQWEIEHELKKAYEQDANKISEMAVQTTKRPLLNYEMFPSPDDESRYVFHDFGDDYRQALENLNDNARAGMAPSEAEIELHLGRSGADRSSRRRRDNEQEATIIDLLCQERAQDISFYMNVHELPGYEFWSNYEYAGIEQGVEDCWRSQLSYWIIEDVIETSDAMNANYPSVMEAPVKRIMRIGFDGSNSGSIRGRSEHIRLARYAQDTEDWLIDSFTSRVSDSTVDVVHFNVQVLIDAGKILPFMKELSSAKTHTFRGWNGTEQEQTFKRNQITVLQSSYQPIERKVGEHEFYRYGENAVVKLDLICEYMFYKDGYEEVKPDIAEQPEEEEDDVPFDDAWY